ncbi:hypothetical protein [Nocardia cyriacigeorgica]|uniref:hypothetical protein n=1 Tax=Nocardia cyriacigeorgica TaxID=135487 RepID=UPI0013D0617A|nr:hypothetical protein [Nocardia cyriacigeorgica]NEW27265.1 hypothetical protein [Nocardia cyriacigeorgica]
MEKRPTPWLDSLERAHRIREARLREQPDEPSPVPVEQIPDGRPMIYGRDYYIDDHGDTVLTSGYLRRAGESLVAVLLAAIGVRR